MPLEPPCPLGLSFRHRHSVDERGGSHSHHTPQLSRRAASADRATTQRRFLPSRLNANFRTTRPRCVRERNHSVLSESPIETCHLYQWGFVSTKWYFGTDPRHNCRGEVAAIKFREQRTMKPTLPQDHLSAAPIGTPALTTAHAQTPPRTKITTKIRDRKSTL